MTDRWFSEDELAQLSRPTMDRAVEAIDAGDLESARRLCTEMKHEWQMLHDLMAAGVLDLVSFIQQQLGEDAVGEAWEHSMNRGWRRHHDLHSGRRGRLTARLVVDHIDGALGVGDGDPVRPRPTALDSPPRIAVSSGVRVQRPRNAPRTRTRGPGAMSGSRPNIPR